MPKASLQMCGRLLILGMLVASYVTAEVEGQDKSATAAEQYQSLLKQYQVASSSGRVLSDEERLKFVGVVYKLRNKLALELIKLAEKSQRIPSRWTRCCRRSGRSTPPPG